MPSIDASDRLIVALDLPDVNSARHMVETLGSAIRFYKIGLTLQVAAGAEGLVRGVIASGSKVFLDYKYYDVPETVAKAVAQACRLGVSFLTIHGARGTIQGAVRGRGSSDLKLFAVTVLTSMDANDMAELGYTNHTVEELVLFRAKMALDGGCDGVIASGMEADRIKQISEGKLLVVTPGIRPEGYPDDDQKRKMTARDAILAGADYLVVGRPITGTADPKAEADRMVAEMQSAFDAL